MNSTTSAARYSDSPGRVPRPAKQRFESNPFGKPMLDAARRSSQVQWRFGTTAWGVFRTTAHPGVRVAISRDDGAALIDGAALLIATGAYDLPVAFPAGRCRA